MKHYTIPLILFCFLISPIAQSRVVCPRVVSEHTADTSNWQRFRNFSQWKDKQGGELALAVWKYLCGYETGLYHFNEILEGNDPFDEYATVRDPQKILNTYNMAYCGIFGPVLDGIYQNIGFERGRAFGVSLWNHCATELWYDNKWHYYDLDVRGVLLDENGEVISLKEAQTHRKYWVDPPVPIQPFFPNDPDKDKVYKIYRDSRIDYYYRWFEGSHTMDYVLRQGESFTRWWKPQGGRWHHRPKYNQIPWVMDLLKQKPKGMKPNHRHFTRWNHGNGKFHYAPDLTNATNDFYDGALAWNNLKSGNQGLQLLDDGKAEAIFNVFTPYIIVAKIHEIDNPADDTEASRITLAAGKTIDVSLSLDHGKTWHVVDKLPAGEEKTLDLTKWVKGTYGYQLKLATKGKRGETALNSLQIETWVQVAPISLPRLKKGLNHLRYFMEDRYGKQTEPVLVTPNTGVPADLKNHLTSMPRDYDPERHTSRIRGEAVLHLPAPAGKKIAWFSVGAAFRTHQGEHAKQTKNRILYAVNQPSDFQEIYDATVPTWVNHWRYNWDTDVRLTKPANDVFVKFIGEPGLNTMRACLHVLPKAKVRPHLSITHGYKIQGTRKTKTIHLYNPIEYVIECEGEPENEFIKLAVPSGGGFK